MKEERDITPLKPNVRALFILMTLASSMLLTPRSSFAQRSKINKDSIAEKQSMEARTRFFDAIREKNLGQFDAAISDFRKSIELDPSNDAAWYEIARINVSNGNLVDAKTNAQKALQLSPDNLFYTSLNADIHLQLGQAKEALKLYQSIISKKPDNVEAYLAAASIYESQKNFSEANKYYTLAEDQMGAVLEIIQQKINNYITAHDFDAAIREVSRLIKNYPEEREFKEILSDLYLYNKQEDLAISTLNEILKSDPNAGGANLKLAKIAIDKKDLKKSMAHAKIAFRAAELPIDSKMEVMFAYFEAAAKDTSLLSELEELASIFGLIHPDDSRSFAVYGDVLNSAGKYHLAIDQYRKAVKITPNKNLIWQEIISLDARILDNDALIRDSEKCIELFPTLPVFYYFSGLGHTQKKEYTKAIESLEMGLSLVVENKETEVQFYASLGDAYNGNGNHRKSDEYYDKALKIHPDDTYVLNNYSYYLSLRSEKLEQAKEMALHVNKLVPNQPNYQDTYAWILYKLKDYQTAKEWLDKALSEGGNSGEIFEHYGDVQFQLGNANLAVEYWQKAKQAGDASSLIDKKIMDKKLVE